MKKQILLTTILLGALTSCSPSAERPAVVNAKAEPNIVALEDLAEITGADAKAVYVAGSPKDAVKKLDASLAQKKIEGKVDAVLKKVQDEAKKSILDKHLSEGSVALVVLPDQIKIYKVTSETELSVNYDLKSLKYVSLLKASIKADVQSKAMIDRQMGEYKYASPKKLGEKFGLIEISSIKIEKTGVLENEKTPYGERKAVLNIDERPFALSTHILLGAEIGAAKKASEEGEEAAE